MDHAQLLAQFREAMMDVFDAAQRLKPPYFPRDFRKMVLELGAKQTADKLLAPGPVSTGFTELFLRGKEALKLSVEYLALKHPWRQLFGPEQLAIARNRLQDVECELPPEDGIPPAPPTDGDESEPDTEYVGGNYSDSVVLFNNCNNREHEKLFGRGAFYDLTRTGIQATQAVNLPRGQECIVSTAAADGMVIFTWYSFVTERLLRDRSKAGAPTLYRVFFGDRLMAETLSKEEAAAHPRYRAFFNVKGRFKQRSTIIAPIPASERPTGPPPDSSAIRALRQKLHELQRPGRPETPAAIKRVRRLLELCERPNAITRYVKRTRGSICQMCGYQGFKKRDGSLYCEAHHVFHLCSNPPADCLAPEYLVILCATCHRRIHYAEVGDPIREEKGWRVRVDTEEVLFQV